MSWANSQSKHGLLIPFAIQRNLVESLHATIRVMRSRVNNILDWIFFVIDGFRQRQLAFPARFWWSRVACLRSKAKTSWLVDSGPAFFWFCDSQCKRRFGRNFHSLSLLPLLSWAIFNVWKERWSSEAPFSSNLENFQGTEMLLLTDREDHKLEEHKSSNCSSCSIYCSIFSF